MQSRVTIVGAGLVGSLLATLLAQRGVAVDLYEKRADPRRAGFAGGRSINLALSGRGLDALRMAGLQAAALEQAVTMRGRIVHARDGSTTMQPYGIDEREVNHSISRGGLNMLLLDAGEAAGVVTHFGARLVDANFGAQRLTFADGEDRRHEVAAPLVIGADGAGSTLRMLINRQHDLGERIEPLGHSYKELEIPPLPTLPENALNDDLRAQRDAGEHFAIASNGLHIWPRGHCMCIALPNREGSFTVTLFLPREGEPPSFASLGNAPAARAYFEGDYTDALALMPEFGRLWEENPVSSLATLHLRKWHLDGQALLVGDAAHAIVPFHGQGMNAGFEDAAILAPMLAEDGDPAAVFARYAQQRRPDADAIAAMALENYVEMRDGVVDPDYLRRRHLGALLAARAPDYFMPRYRMVTFTGLPYAYCLERGRAQTTLLDQLLRGHADVDAIDLDAAVRALKATLPPLPHST